MKWDFDLFFLCFGPVSALFPCYLALISIFAALVLDLIQKREVIEWRALSALTDYILWSIIVLASTIYLQSDRVQLLSIGCFLISLCLYHSSEHFCTAIFHSESVSWHSFLIDQSWNYAVAMAFAFMEHFGKLYFECFSAFIWRYSFACGLGLVALGQILRIGAEINAGTNFTHVIRSKRSESHNLVTWGLYSLCRHPSYFGWFLWSVGTQILLCNPICTVLYFFACRKFFSERIELEEIYLKRLFSREYEEYQGKTRAFPAGFEWMLG